MSIGKGSLAGSIGHMPLTTRYEANKSTYKYQPQYNNTYRGRILYFNGLGMSTVQSMQQLPDTGSIQDNRSMTHGGHNRRESVLQSSARNSLQL